MELFILEHKKLWRKKTVVISVLLCVFYTVIFGGVLAYQWYVFGSAGDHAEGDFGNNFDGYANIRAIQARGQKWRGELTDETIRQMAAEYQNLTAAGAESETAEKTNLLAISGWLRTLWPELERPERDQLMISYVEPEKLTDFYQRRRKMMESFLDENKQFGGERAFLLGMNEQVREPFYYEWSEGWTHVTGVLTVLVSMVLAVFLAVALSTLFAGEWHDRTGELLLTTAKGWEYAARAKLCAGFAFTLELCGLIIAGNVAAQLIYLGTSGWDMPVQLVKLLAAAPMNMLQAEIYQYAFILLGALGFAGAAMLISAAVKNNFVALLLSLALAYCPVMIAGYLPYGARKVLELLPLAGSPTAVFRTDVFTVFGKIIWSPYLLLIVPVLLGGCCVPFAVKKWAKRLRV